MGFGYNRLLLEPRAHARNLIDDANLDPASICAEFAQGRAGNSFDRLPDLVGRIPGLQDDPYRYPGGKLNELVLADAGNAHKVEPEPGCMHIDPIAALAPDMEHFLVTSFDILYPHKGRTAGAGS